MHKKYNHNPEGEISLTKTKYAISFSEKKLMHLIHEEGYFNENVWKLSHEIALLSLNLGINYIKKKDFEKGEAFISKAKKVTDLPNQSVNWDSKLDWQIIRLNIFQNLAFIYQNQKKTEKAYELLKSLAKHIKPENIGTQNAEIIVSSIDNLYINLANLCYSLQNYDETILYSKLGIKFLNSVFKNPDLLSKIEDLLKKNQQELNIFIKNKKELIAYLFHLIGKTEMKLMDKISALNNFQQAYILAKENQGEEHSNTKKYKKKYYNLKSLLDRPRNSGSSLSENDNLSPNMSPLGKKAKYIKNFIQSHDNQTFLRRINSKENVSQEDENNKKIGSSPKIHNKIHKSFFFKTPNELVFDFQIKREEKKEEKSIIKLQETNVDYPRTFGEAIKTEPKYLEKQTGFHTKSYSNVSDIYSFLLKSQGKGKKKKIFHRSNFSHNALYLNSLEDEVNSKSSQRNLLYTTSSFSTRPTPKTENKGQEDTLFQKLIPSNEEMAPPKKHLFFLTSRPISQSGNIQPIAEEINAIPKKSLKEENMINKIPSITINSINELMTHSIQQRIIKTPKSSFTSLNTPKVVKTISNPSPIFKVPERKSKPFEKSFSSRKNMSIKIPGKQSTASHISFMKSSATPGNSSLRKFSNSNSNFFSGRFPNKEEKKHIETINSKKETEISPMKFKMENVGISKIDEGFMNERDSAIFFRKMTTIEVPEDMIKESVNVKIDESILREKAAVEIQRFFRKCIAKTEKKDNNRNSPPFIDRISYGSVKPLKESLDLRNLKKSSDGSVMTSSITMKYSPRKEEPNNNEVFLDLPKESLDQSIISEEAQEFDILEKRDFLPFKFLMNNQEKFWYLQDFDFKKTSNFNKNMVFFYLRNRVFNLYFTWIMPLSSRVKSSNSIWEFANDVLSVFMEETKQNEFFQVQKSEIFENDYLLPKEIEDTSNSVDFSEFAMKLSFFLKNFFVLKRKSVGKVWVYSKDLEANNKRNFLESQLKLHLEKKRQIIKNFLCFSDVSFTQEKNIKNLKKLFSLNEIPLNYENRMKNAEEYSLFSKISSPATSENNYQKNRGLPPLKPQRPSISLTVYENHIRLFKKAGMENGGSGDDEDYKFQTLVQPPILLTQLRTTLSKTEINRSENNIRESTVKEVSEDIIELSEDSRNNKGSQSKPEDEKDSQEQQSVIIKKGQFSNEYISIENAIKSGVLNLKSESNSPQSPYNRRYTISPTNKSGFEKRFFAKKSLTAKPEESQFQELVESVMKNSWKTSEENFPSNSRIKPDITAKIKKKLIKNQLLEAEAILEERSPTKMYYVKEKTLGDFKFTWDYHKNLEAIPLKSEIFQQKHRNFVLLPEKLINSFEDQEILFQKILKLQKHFFILLIKINVLEEKPRIIDFIKNIDKEILFNVFHSLGFKLELIQINSNYKLTYEENLSSEKFDENFLENTFLFDFLDLMYFFHFKKFSRKTCAILQKNLKKISIENCKLNIAEKKDERIPIVPAMSPIRNRILEHYEETISKIAGTQDSLVLHDPNIHRMKFYNSINMLTRYKYYEFFNKRSSFGPVYLRVQFFANEEKDLAKISIYEPLKKKIHYQEVHSQIIYEKLINFMQISHKSLKESMFKSFFLNYQTNFIGKKIKLDVFNRQIKTTDQKLFEGDFNFFFNFTQNIFSKRDNPIIYHYFDIKIFYESYEIENMGRAYIKVSMFTLKPIKKSLFPHNFSCFFLFEIYQNSVTRYKLDKFILTIEDIALYINFQFINGDVAELLPQLNQTIFNNFVYSKSRLYKSLQLPYSKFSQSSNKKFYVLKMDLNKFSLQQTGLTTFLKPELNTYRIIYQAIKKIFGLFAIITVKKYHILKFWSISFYFPKTNRDFSINLYNSDIYRMTSGFFEELFPISMKEIQEIFCKYKMKRMNYYIFSMEYETLMKNKNQINKETLEIQINKKKQHNDSPFFSNSKLLMSFVEVKVIFI